MTPTPKRRSSRGKIAPMSEVEDKRPRGRPTLYDPAFCDVVIEAGREGCSKAEIAALLGVTRETLDIWARTHADFSDAVHLARELSLAWWEKQARTNLATSGYQSGLWKQAMSGRFPAEPYRERTELAGPGGGPIEAKGLGGLASLPREKRDAIRAAVQAALQEDER